jgi:hypothetical protein
MRWEIIEEMEHPEGRSSGCAEVYLRGMNGNLKGDNGALLIAEV